MKRLTTERFQFCLIICVVFLCLPLQITLAQKQITPRYSLILRGDSLFRTGNSKAADNTYKNILRIDAYDTLALQRLGRIAYIDEDWGKSKDFFGKILEKYETNSHAHYFMGIAYRESGKYKALLLRKLDWDKAKKHFEAVIEGDSLFRDVVFQYAILLRYRDKYEQALAMAHRQIRLKPELTAPQVKIFRIYRYFITHRDEKAIHRWAVQQQTDHARYAVGERWRRQGNLIQADSLFRDMLRDSVQMPRSPLWLSRVKIYTEQEQFIQADSCFWAAVDKINNPIDADLIMEDLKYLLNEKEWLLYLNLHTSSDLKVFIKNFWMKRNPMPAATWNVRLLEHYKRLIYSEKHYEYDGFRGWFMDPDPLSHLEYPLTRKLNNEYNDKGLIYIRHGEPNEREVTTGEDVPFNESWLYYKNPFHPQLTFHFIAGKPGNDWRFAPFVTHPAMLEDRLTWGNIYFQLLRADPLEFIQYQEEMAEMSRQSISHALTSDRHRWRRELKPLDIPLTYYTFRGEDGKTLTELSYAIPAPTDFKKEYKRLAEANISYEIGIAVFNREFSEIINKRDTVNLEFTRDSIFIDLNRFILVPDTYLVGFHIKPQNMDFLGGYKFRWGIDDYSGSELLISHIQLATDISPASDSSQFVKHGLKIIPNPSGRFSRENLLYSYLEIYNLTLNSDGRGQFSIEYRLTHTNPRRRGITNLFGLLGGVGTSSISIQSERESAAEFSVEYLALDVNNLQSGSYELNITIKDELSNENVSRQTNLFLY